MRSLRSAAVHLLGSMTAVSGLHRILRRRRRHRGRYRLYILEYHDVSRHRPEGESIISVSRFDRHLTYLRRHYRLTTLAEAVERLRLGDLRQDLVVCSFDDGYRDNHRSAWPTLRRHGAPAIFFLTSGFLDGRELWFDRAARVLAAARRTPRAAAEGHRRWSETFGRRLGSLRSVEDGIEALKRLPTEPRERLVAALAEAAPEEDPATAALTWSQVRTIASEGGEIGCHTVSHPILSTLSEEEQWREIARSSDRIREETGARPVFFAYPNGTESDFDRATLGVLRSLRFEAACTTVRGSNRPGCDLFTLRRIGVGSDSTAVLAARLAGLFDQELRALPAGLGSRTRREPA